QEHIVRHSGVQQQGGVLDHVTASGTRRLDGSADARIEAQHQADFQVITLATVAGLDEESVDVIFLESAIENCRARGVNGQLIASLVRHRPLWGVTDTNNADLIPKILQPHVASSYPGVI